MRQRTARQWIGIVGVLCLLALLTRAESAPRPEPGPEQIAARLAAAGLPSPDDPCDDDAAYRYVAGGDAVVKGTDIDTSEDDRYSDKLLTDRLQKAPGPWCLFNTAKDPTTTDQYTGEEAPTQQAKAHDLRPRLITLTLGRQNATINDHVTTCLQKIKDHDFIEANTCALQVLLDTGAWDELTKDLAEILNRFKIQMDGNPELVVAVTGYFNPYPSATSVATELPGFCAKLTDTIPTCVARWILLPPALVTLDQVVKKLNTTIGDVVQRFTQGSQGRFVFVNPYDKFSDHCTKMEVEIKTTVYHPTNTVHDHDSKNDFGCNQPWIATDGEDGTKSPFLYLTPAVTGVLIKATQTTKGMGIHPNAKGHDCIADLIWEAVKHKLGVPEAPEEACS